MKNQLHILKKILGVFTLILVCVCIVIGVYIAVSTYTRFGRSGLAAYYPSDVSLYAEIPASFLHAQSKGADAFKKSLMNEIPVTSEFIRNNSVPVDALFEKAQSMSFGMFVRDNSVHSLMIIEISPTDANAVLKTVAQGKQSDSDGVSGIISMGENGIDAISFKYAHGLLFISSNEPKNTPLDTLISPSFETTTEYKKIESRAGDSHGFFYISSEDVVSHIIPAFREKNIITPFISENAQFSGTLSYEAHSLRVTLIGAGSGASVVDHTFANLLESLPSNVVFVSFGSYPKDSTSLSASTGIDFSQQYDLLLNTIETQYGIAPSDPIFDEIFSHVVFFAVPDASGLEYGVSYSLDESKRTEHISRLEKILTDIVKSTATEEKDLVLSDGTIAKEIVPKKQTYVFKQDLETSFMTPINTTDGTNGSVDENAPSYRYRDGVMTIIFHLKGARQLTTKKSSDSILSLPVFTAFNTHPELYSSGVYVDMQNTKMPFMSRYVNYAGIMEGEKDVDLEFYIK